MTSFLPLATILMLPFEPFLGIASITGLLDFLGITGDLFTAVVLLLVAVFLSVVTCDYDLAPAPTFSIFGRERL